MKNIIKAGIGGMLLVVTLFFAIEGLDWFILRQGSQLSFIERNPAGWLLEWPLPLLKNYFPAEKGAMVKLSLLGIIVALTLNVLLYSLLAYLVIWWRNRQQRLP